MIWAAFFGLGLVVVFVSYAGYALWVAWLARVRPVPTAAKYLPDALLPTVTCVMAAANEAVRIRHKLRALVHQDYPPDKLSIIVVSDGSTDATDAIVRAWARRDHRIRLMRTERRSGKPTALNLARPEIASDVAVLMDPRQAITHRAIRELVAQLADPDVGVVSGDLRVKGDAYWTYEGYVRKCESRSGSMVQVTGSLYALRTVDLPEIPPDTILDDVYVPLTVALGGRRIVMAEAAGSLDVATRSAGNEFVRKVRTLAGLVQICHRVDGCLNPTRNPVWGRFVVHKLSRLACPYGLLLMLVGAVMAARLSYGTGLLAGAGVGLVALTAWRGPAPRAVSRVVSLLRSFLALNLAAFWAMPSYYLGRTSVTWQRVEVDRT
ncbi:MAG TPA: glycosyltransferase [Methylomirabilota bacterium]|nr:glycosyltransferase [Methylomirabilota bacterium]